jgi:hypothetical protein
MEPPSSLILLIDWLIAHSRVWTQDFMLTRQVFYHLSHILSLNCFNCFLDKVSCFLYTAGLWNSSVSHIAGIIEAHCHTQLVCWNGILLILHGLVSNHSPPDICLLSIWNYGPLTLIIATTSNQFASSHLFSVTLFWSESSNISHFTWNEKTFCDVHLGSGC